MSYVQANLNFFIQFFNYYQRINPGSWLTYGWTQLCQVSAFFLTVNLGYLLRLLEFSLWGLPQVFILLDSNVVDFTECTYFIKVIHILV